MSANNSPALDPLRVLFLAAEADPFIKVGGLGDVGGSLPRALRSLPPLEAGGRSIDARLVIPFHGAMDRTSFSARPLASYPVATHDGSLQSTIFYSEASGVPVYLISGGPITRAQGVYSLNTREDGEKFTFFSLAALELPRQLGWRPDIIHANDWHTALAVYALSRKRGKDAFFAHTHSVLTLHNLPFMGAGAEDALSEFDLPAAQDELLPEWARTLPLPLGLLSADRIVAVSPTYAREILTPAFGNSLEGFLQARSSVLAGILNGIDTLTWDPAREAEGVASYSAASLDVREVNKAAVQARFSFSPRADRPLLAFIGRMDPQKGVDQAFEALEQISDLDWQAIILGTGIPTLEAAARTLENAYPDRIRAVTRFDSRLSHQLYAGADMLLMPSRYEPCGLAQMIAMRYGCVPVAHATGGLQDTIVDASNPDGTGFLFEQPTAQGFAEALRRAMLRFPERDFWQSMQRRGMAGDYSWRRSAAEYARLYQQIMEEE